MRKWYVTMIEKLYFIAHWSCESRSKPFAVRVEARNQRQAMQMAFQHPDTPQAWVDEEAGLEKIIQVVGVSAA